MNKKFKLIIVFTFFGILSCYSQIDYWLWDKIIINDLKGGWTSWDNKYQIDRLTLNLSKVGEEDTIIGKIDSTLIIDLFNSLNTTLESNQDPLLMFGKDSTWLINNAEKLWYEYLENQNEKAKIDSIAIQKLRNYNSYKKIIMKMQGTSWTDDYPLVDLIIINKNDTSYFQTFGQHQFMLPWYGTNGTIYNSNLSKTIGNILPINNNSNKYRLTGNYFNNSLIYNIYKNYIETEIETERAKSKYKLGFKKIGKHFQIESAEIVYMSSLEWGGEYGAKCLELNLSDSSISENIQFSTVFGRHILRHPLSPIIRKKNQLINQLKDNPVFNYCIKNDSCLGEIHLVNHKSLSGKAKRNFLEDVKKKNQDLYKGKFKKAIFFELSENRSGDRSFSRWIFFKNGSIVLWQLNGPFLMNLSNSNSLGNGYICKPMDINELKSKTKIQTQK